MVFQVEMHQIREGVERSEIVFTCQRTKGTLPPAERDGGAAGVDGDTPRNKHETGEPLV